MKSLVLALAFAPLMAFGAGKTTAGTTAGTTTGTTTGTTAGTTAATSAGTTTGTATATAGKMTATGTTVAAATTAPATTGTALDVKITGMTCGDCVKKVQDELAKLQGVDKATLKVELTGNHATMTVAKADDKTMEAIKAAVTKAGFKVDKINVAAATTGTKTN